MKIRYSILQIARDLDLFLEKYGRVLTRQIQVPVDWLADPRRKNNTWEPWLNAGAMLYAYENSSTGITVYFIHLLCGFLFQLIVLKVCI